MGMIGKDAIDASLKVSRQFFMAAFISRLVQAIITERPGVYEQALVVNGF